MGTLCFLMIGTTAFSQSSLSGYRKAILKYTNEYRADHGLPPVRQLELPESLAEKHSRKMARRQVGFGHGGFQGRTNALKRAYGRNIATGENVAYGKISARKVMDIWIHSRPHRKNLLGNFNGVGIGISRDKNGLLFFTQLFVRK